ncbi:EAL domain-containing protein [Treponema sp.]|uniref:EAL domain-containing protein n=1 Tax=Treponema sp. TaxID=166 RepID=UPI0025D27507|nr:EAL domain-containing protein [Treponema sp.]MCR5217387.1 EAL domain-containing protein [Treponema sp.]
MYNYGFVIPDFVILLVFLVFYFTKRRIPVRLNKSFLNILVVEIIVLVLDVLASRKIECPRDTEDLIITTINVFFFAAFVLRTAFFYFFTYNAVDKHIKKNNWLYYSTLVIFILSETAVLINYFYPLIFSFEDGIYQKGKFYNLLYISCFYFIIVSLCQVFINRKKNTLRTSISLTAYNLVLFSGYICRIAFKNFLVMDFFCLIAIVIIYLSFQNPDLFMEEKTGTFNTSAFIRLMDEIKKTHNSYIKALVIRHYHELREVYGNIQMDRGIAMIGEYLLKNFPKFLIFYLRNGVFTIVNANSECLDGNVCEQISERFLHTWCAGKDSDLLLEPGFIHVSRNLKNVSADEILNAIMSSINVLEKNDLTDTIITNEIIEDMEQVREVKLSVERAVEQNTVELFLQPLVDVNKHNIIGAEALARIRDSEGNIIPPVKFIPVAEKNGRINILGEQIFEKACRFIKENDVAAMGISWINVNLSPIQFLRRDLNERFSAILQKYQVPANMIHLEITEESMIDYVLLRRQILTMQQSGFQFVLDDYGSGYSNVTRLKHCPFINVKLDMEVVWDYFKEQDKILPTLVETFKQMNFTVTAEGIESNEIAFAMKNIGCDYLQGYYFDKPLPVDVFLRKYSNKDK